MKNQKKAREIHHLARTRGLTRLSYRQWARQMYRGDPGLSPKLAGIVRGATPP